jgi:hypothetical protein
VTTKRQRAIAKLAKMKRDRDLDNATAAHWNRMHPNEEPMPESDPTVDAVLLDLERKLMNPNRESGKA